MEKHEAVEYIHQALKAQHSPEAIAAELCRRTGAPANLMSTFVAREIAAAQAADRAQESAKRPVPQAPAPVAFTPTPAFVEEPDELPPPSGRYVPAAAFEAPPEPVNRAEIPGITGRQPPLSAPGQQAELARKVVKKLQGHASESDVILMVCDETGMSWAEAGEYVKKVAHENRRSIQGRLNLILIPMGLGVLIGGLAFFVNGLERIYAMYLLATATDPNAANLAMGFDYRAFLVALTGLAMIVGGAYGLYQSFKSFWE